ncbi:MAG: LysE family translocator [Pseudomonadota bacterium]
MLENLLTLLPAALALMGSPGPATMACAGFGAAFPWRTSAILVITITAGTATVILLVALGVTGLITAIPGVAPVLTVLAGLYMVHLAWKIATAPPLGAQSATPDTPSPLGVYAMAIANPKAYAAMGALFSGFPLIEDDPVMNGVVKCAVLIALALSVNFGWMATGAALSGWMRNPRANRALNVTFAVLLVASVLAMLLL